MLDNDPSANELRLAQMKKAIRAAMPDGAGDFTVTKIARAALALAEQWLKPHQAGEREKL